MSFSKMNLCESTQVAFEAFHLFRGNMINMLETWSSEADEYICARIKPTGEYEGEGYPSAAHLKHIAQELSGYYSQPRVHDILTYTGMYQTSDRRVDFEVPTSSGKIILTLIVRSMFIDGDEASGDTAWRVADITFQFISTSYPGHTGKCTIEKFRILQGHHQFPNEHGHRNENNLSDAMQRVFDGALYQCDSDKVTT